MGRRRAARALRRDPRDATVTAGDSRIQVRGESDYALGHLRVGNGGAREIVIHAGSAGAHVTDLTVTAR